MTDTGESCLLWRQQMLALVQDVREETSSRTNELRGQLRLACSTSLAYAQITASSGALSQAAPTAQGRFERQRGCVEPGVRTH